MPKKKSPARKTQPRAKAVPPPPQPPPSPPPPQFDPDDPDVWLDHITENAPPFIKSLCKCLYYENLLVRSANRAILCDWGRTSQGRFGVISEEDPAWTVEIMPPQGRMLPAGDEHYKALVLQEDPEAAAPWAYAAAAFKYAGGNVPQAPPGADAWRLIHVYPNLNRITPGNRDEVALAAAHFTQSANLVAVHPVVCHLIADYPCILRTIEARAFTAFGDHDSYDPLQQFVPGRGRHDKAGFVLNDEPVA